MSYPVKKISKYHTVPLDPADYDRFIPTLELAGDDLTQMAAHYLQECDKKIHYLINHHFSPIDVHKIRSLMMDQLIVGLYQSIKKGLLKHNGGKERSCALIATGGYGREEMSLLSDIDLLLIYDGHLEKYHKPLIEKILYILWDLKLEVGHAVRTISECKRLMHQDQTIFTALLDARLLVGDEKIFKRLIQIRQNFLKNRLFRKGMIRAKVRERFTRLKKYGGSVYLLEPHLKEGEGGLRDLQLFRWLAKIVNIQGDFDGLKKAGYVNDEVCESLKFSLNYFLGLRNKLHDLTKRKGNQLNFQTQVVMAQEMGFEDSQGALGVEQFMQGFYSTAAQVKINIKTLIQKIKSDQHGFFINLMSRIRTKYLDEHFKIINGKIAVISEQVFEENPHALFTCFEHVQKTGFGIHFQTKDIIEKNLFRVNDKFRKDPHIRAALKEMMGNFHNLGKTLFTMHEVHFFDVLIPEFRKIRNRMQHDSYHVYTVDTHSLFAINELSKLSTNPDYEKKIPLFDNFAFNKK